MMKISNGIAMLLIGAAFFGWCENAGAAPPAPSPVVSYPVKDFADGKARFYEYKADSNIKIKYFILRSSDGMIRAAFDACDVCWPEGKGYFQQGDFMVCRNCGRKFASVRVNEVKGGCNPAPLNRQLVGDALLIKVADILEGKGYFDFSQRGKR
jgi:uncharacterized membrane protein